MNDNNQGACWALVHIPRNPKAVAAPDGGATGNPGDVGGQGSASTGRSRRGAEKRKRWPIEIEVNGVKVSTWFEINRGQTLVLRRKNGRVFFSMSIDELILREYRRMQGSLCL